MGYDLQDEDQPGQPKPEPVRDPALEVDPVSGGMIPDEDHAELYEAGFTKIYGPGADTREIVEFIRKEARK